MSHWCRLDCSPSRLTEADSAQPLLGVTCCQTMRCFASSATFVSVRALSEVCAYRVPSNQGQSLKQAWGRSRDLETSEPGTAAEAEQLSDSKPRSKEEVSAMG